MNVHVVKTEGRKTKVYVVVGDLQGVSAAVRSLNKVAEQQQSPF